MRLLSHLTLHAALVLTYIFLETTFSAGWLFAISFLFYFVLTTRRPMMHVIAIVLVTLQFIATVVQSLILGSVVFFLINVYCLSINDSFLHTGAPEKETPETSESKIETVKTQEASSVGGEAEAPTPVRAKRRVMSPQAKAMVDEAVDEAREQERIRMEIYIDRTMQLRRIRSIENPSPPLT
jgi:hypothetical protein